MSSTSTVSEWSLPWGSEEQQATEERLHLAVVWSLAEPGRLGEAAPVAGPCVLGRGSGKPAEPGSRVLFGRRRPMGSSEPSELADERISRDQLELAPTDDGGLSVERIGKCPLFVNGERLDQATVRHGDSLVLHNVLVLLVVRRPVVLEPLRSYPAARAFGFGTADPQGLVGESPAAWSLRDAIAFAASSSEHVLILGPSGSGKELAARAVHALSRRAAQRLVTRNAATFPEGLVDAELFGNVKNYPNPGTPARPGLIGAAHGSSLFLDEIAELPRELQAHLLRVLDRDGEYQRLGDAEVSRADLRMIAATNRDPDELKHDLRARFPLRIELPPLDERREDIPLLVRHLLDRAARDTPDLLRFFDQPDRPEARVARLDPRLMEALVRHDFQHELRELERLLWLAVSTSRSHFIAATPEVMAELRCLPPEAPGPRRAAELDRESVEEALAGAGGNVTEAAKALGLTSRFALYRLMKRHGVRSSETGG